MAPQLKRDSLGAPATSNKMRVSLPRKIFVALLAAAACVHGSQANPGFAVGQCYALTVGAWSPAIVPASDSIFHRFPPQFQLMGDSVSDQERRVLPDIVHPWARQKGSWRVSGSTLYTSWGDGFTGVQVELRDYRDSLRGQARLFTDNQASSYRNAKAAASARLVPCGALDSSWGQRSKPPGA